MTKQMHQRRGHAPEKPSTTGVHHQEIDIMDASRSLQSIGVMRVFGMETRNLRSSYVTATASSGPVISEEITGLPHTAVEGTTIEAYGRRSMRKLHGTKQKLCSGNKWILLLT